MEQEVILREDICYHLWNLCHFGHKTLEKKGKIGTNGTLGDGNCHFPSSIAPLICSEDRLYSLFFIVTDLAQSL